MGFALNNRLLDLTEINPYSNNDDDVKNKGEVKIKIYTKWKELKLKYFDKGETKLTFVCPSIKSGAGTGNRGGSYPRTTVERTAKEGQVVVVWYDSAIPQTNGAYEFTPAKFTHETKSLVLDSNTDIEKILWLCLFDPLAKQTFTFPEYDSNGVKHPKAGKTIPACY